LHLFQAIADRFPTQRMGRNRALAGLWRVIFYALRPSQPFVMRTAGYPLWVHPRKGTLSRAVIRRGYWEPGVTAAFVEHLAPGAGVIDIGANFGHFTLTAANRVGRDGIVIAFEPEPRTFALLSENVRLGAYANVRIEQKAVSDSAGVLALAIDTGNPGGHSLTAANIAAGAERVDVDVVTIDGYLAAHLPGRRIDVIKIDVQGFESHVLRGARALIARDHPVILCEIAPYMVVESGGVVGDLFAMLADYDAFVLSETAAPRAIAHADAVALLTSLAGIYEDFLFTPKRANPPQTDG
jgi:FkbM family methyltransferase